MNVAWTKTMLLGPLRRTLLLAALVATPSAAPASPPAGRGKAPANVQQRSKASNWKQAVRSRSDRTRKSESRIEDSGSAKAFQRKKLSVASTRRGKESAPRRLKKDSPRRVARLGGEGRLKMQDKRGDIHRVAPQRVRLRNAWKARASRDLLERTVAELDVLSLVPGRDGTPALRVVMNVERARAMEGNASFPTESSIVPAKELILQHQMTYLSATGETSMLYHYEIPSQHGPAKGLFVQLNARGEATSVALQDFQGVTMRSHTTGGNAQMDVLFLP